MSLKFAPFLLLAASLSLAADGLLGRGDLKLHAPEPGTYGLPVIKPAADGAVLDTSGRPRLLRELTRGRVTVMSFIYTRCAVARACPYATGVLNQLHQLSLRDAELASGLRLVSLSFDPEFDTPAHLARYSRWAAERPGACEWHFVTAASAAELQPILDGYGQAVSRKRNPSDPTGPLHHILRVFLVDTAGRIRNIYSSGTLEPELVLADIRTLLREPPLVGPSPPVTLTPAEAAAVHGELTARVVFQAATTARVSEITGPGREVLRELLIVDAPNGDHPATPIERASIVVSIPAEAFPALGVESPADLEQRLHGRDLCVIGTLSTRPAPAAPGGRQAWLTVFHPGQLVLSAVH